MTCCSVLQRATKSFSWVSCHAWWMFNAQPASVWMCCWQLGSPTDDESRSESLSCSTHVNYLTSFHKTCSGSSHLQVSCQRKKKTKTTHQMLNCHRCYKQHWLWRQKWTHLGYIKSYLKRTWVSNADSQINFLSFTRRWKWLVDEECGSEDMLQDRSRLLNYFSWRYRTPVLDA